MKESIQPVSSSDRIQSLDILRGLAILGILIMNIQSFAMPGAAYMNPMAFGDMNSLNGWVWKISHIFADQKFMTIFSILYGAGIVLVTQKAENKFGKSAGLHYRRTFWLLRYWSDSRPPDLVRRYISRLCPLRLICLFISQNETVLALDPRSPAHFCAYGDLPRVWPESVLLAGRIFDRKPRILGSILRSPQGRNSSSYRYLRRTDCAQFRASRVPGNLCVSHFNALESWRINASRHGSVQARHPYRPKNQKPFISEDGSSAG